LANALHQTPVAGTAPFQPKITNNPLVPGSLVRVMPVSFFWLRHLQSFAGVDTYDKKPTKPRLAAFQSQSSTIFTAENYYHANILSSQ
jgi:hypothetical protein